MSWIRSPSELRTTFNHLYIQFFVARLFGLLKNNTNIQIQANLTRIYYFESFPMTEYTRKSSKSIVLWCEWCFRTSEICNPEQNDAPNPFMTSILVPNGLTNRILTQGTTMEEPRLRRCHFWGLLIYIYIYIYIHTYIYIYILESSGGALRAPPRFSQD